MSGLPFQTKGVEEANSALERHFRRAVGQLRLDACKGRGRESVVRCITSPWPSYLFLKDGARVRLKK